MLPAQRNASTRALAMSYVASSVAAAPATRHVPPPSYTTASSAPAFGIATTSVVSLASAALAAAAV